jgi:hypothetical protein
MNVDLFTDFDYTLSNDNCEDGLLRHNLDRLNQKYEPLGFPIKIVDDYWAICHQRYPGTDGEVGYLQAFIEEINDGTLLNANGGAVTKADLYHFGKEIDIANGVFELFDHLKQKWNGKLGGPNHLPITIRIFVISAGIDDMIRGSGIGEHVDGIAACDLDEKEPFASQKSSDQTPFVRHIKHVVTGFSKTAAIIEAVKGSGRCLNDAVKQEDYVSHYGNGIVMGDGFSDMSMIGYCRKKGAKTIGVYAVGNEASYQKALKVLGDRVDGIAPRDYQIDGPTHILIDKFITEIVAPDRCTFPTEIQHMVRKRRTVHDETVEMVAKHHRSCSQCWPGSRTIFIPP